MPNKLICVMNSVHTCVLKSKEMLKANKKNRETTKSDKRTL